MVIGGVSYRGAVVALAVAVAVASAVAVGGWWCYL